MSNNSIIEFTATLMSLRDPFENGHIDRVSLWSEMLSKELKLPAPQIEIIRCAGALHDIGKLAIAENVLNKPKITESERIMIHGHSMLGYRLALIANLDIEISAIIRSHHENFDGTGYPDKLADKDIPIGARIVRIVDAYDAMTNIRPYREALTPKETLKIMETNKTHFDPEIFNIFINTFI